MNIALAGTSGGHISELRIICEELIKKENVFYITDITERTRALPGNNYLYKHFIRNVFAYQYHAIRLLFYLKKNTIHCVISNGAEIGIPALLAARLLRIKTIFIEHISRMTQPSISGRICYYLAHCFLVQHPALLKRYGAKASYEGAIL